MVSPKRFILILSFLLLLPHLSSAQVLVDTSIGAGIVLQAIDTNLTTFLIAKNLGKEANPVYVPFASNPIASPIVKSSIAVGASALMLHYKKDHKVLVLIASLSANAFYTYVDYHNGRIAKGHY